MPFQPHSSTKPETESVDLWVFIEGAIGFLSDVTHGGTRLILTFDGQPLGCVVSMDDYQKLQLQEEQKGDTPNGPNPP
jgi:hypothetical protein